MTKRTTYTSILFWLKSSRGTDEKKVRRYKGKPSKARIVDDLEEWASRHPAALRSESYISYGYRRITVPPDGELRERWKRVCARYAKAKSARDTVMAMLTAVEVPD